MCITFSFPSLNFVSAGVDAARAFGTGCFQTHRTHDTRGMSESESKVKIVSCLAFPDSHQCFRALLTGSSTMQNMRNMLGLVGYRTRPSILQVRSRSIATQRKKLLQKRDLLSRFRKRLRWSMKNSSWAQLYRYILVVYVCNNTHKGERMRIYSEQADCPILNDNFIDVR